MDEKRFDTHARGKSVRDTSLSIKQFSKKNFTQKWCL